MTSRELQALILNTPACAAHVHTSDMPQIGADEARVKDQAVADALLASGALLRIVSRQIGDDDVLRELGIDAGDALLGKLEVLAAADSRVKRTLRLLAQGDLDIGHPQTQAVIDALPAPVTEAEKSALKNMAKRADSVTAAEVSNALRGPWGDE